MRTLRRPVPHWCIILGKIGDPPADGDAHQRTNTHGYGYGMPRPTPECPDTKHRSMANTDEDVVNPAATTAGPGTQLVDATQSSQAWNSIFRLGSHFLKGYTDSPRNRSYVIELGAVPPAPVKVKRRAVKATRCASAACPSSCSSC